MTRFLTHVILLSKRQLVQPLFLLLCLSLPAACLLLHRLEQTSASSLSVGLYSEAPDEMTEACFARLLSQNSGITFLSFTDKAAMLDQVARNELDCAYSFDTELTARLLKKDYKNSITCYISPSTIMEDLSREAVFAALFGCLGKELVLSYAEEASLFEATSPALEQIGSSYDAYQGSARIFRLDIAYLDANTKSGTDTGSPAAATLPIRGLIAVWLFISGLSGGITWLSDREQKLPVSAAACILIPLLFMSLSALLTLFLTGEANAPGEELWRLLRYLLLIFLFVRLLLTIIKRPALLSASIPVLTLGSLIFCPIFVNLGALLPLFRLMEKLFLPYYYLRL